MTSPDAAYKGGQQPDGARRPLRMDWSREEEALKRRVQELLALLQVSQRELRSGQEAFLHTCSRLQLEVERNRDLWEQALQATHSLQQERSRSRGQMFLYQRERLHLHQATLLRAQLQRQLEAALQEEGAEPAARPPSEQQLRAAHRQLQDRYHQDVQKVQQRSSNLEKSLEMQIELHACEVLRYEEMDARLRSELEELRRVLSWELDRAAHREAGLLRELSAQQTRFRCREEALPAGGGGAPHLGATSQRLPAAGGGAPHPRRLLGWGLAAGVLAASLATLRLVNKPGA